MAIKINYTLLKKDNNEEIDNDLGKIFFFDKYVTSSQFFPYYFLGEKPEIIKYKNWPMLVDFLYNQKIGIFDSSNNILIDSYPISSYYYNKIDFSLNLSFQRGYRENILLFRALEEDREAYFLENNTYSGWNKTITPINGLKSNSTNILFKDNNYQIQNIDSANLVLKIKIFLPNSINFTNSTERFEFGLYRMEGKNKSESVYFSGLKGKTFQIGDNNKYITGLKSRSTITGHSHDHSHNMDHIHINSHTHLLWNHVHGMNHQHQFYDWTPNNYWDYPILNGTGYSALGILNPPTNTVRTMTEHRGLTKYISNNNTSDFTGDTSPPNDNMTSLVIDKTINKDNINTNDNNSRFGDKNFAENYVIFPYIYGKIYNE